METHALEEVLTPPLILPWQFGSAFEPDEELALEIEQLVEIREKEMDSVLVDHVALRQSSGVFLNKGSK